MRTLLVWVLVSIGLLYLYGSFYTEHGCYCGNGLLYSWGSYHAWKRKQRRTGSGSRVRDSDSCCWIVIYLVVGRTLLTNKNIAFSLGRLILLLIMYINCATERKKKEKLLLVQEIN